MRRSFTLRKLLALALVAGVLLPVAIGAATWFGVRHWQEDRRSAHVTAASKLIEDGVGRFDSPAWRRTARGRLDSLGIGAQVVVAGAHTKGVVFTAGSGASSEFKSAAGSGKTPALNLPPGYFGSLVVPGLNSSSRWVAALLAGIATVVALLTAFSLLARRWVVRPLVALSEGVDAIAGGSAFPRHRPSRVREIDELEEALAAMDENLHAAADRDLRREEERRFLIGSIAHDLRTPLFLLRGHVEALARGVGDAPSNLRRAEAGGRVLDRLVGDLFAFSTLEYRGARPARESVDLADLFRQTAVAFGARAAEKDVAITAEGPEVTTLADEDFLSRVVSNLLDNAVRHVPAGGDVELRWACNNGTIGFTVWNSGDPIPAKDLARLFEPLFRGDSSRNSETGGAGLGLAIARHLIEAHGGTLAAENPPAGGARFAATLPAA
ncbi:MAG: sensor histidine kinase [Gaiellaceae bacterium]